MDNIFFRTIVHAIRKLYRTIILSYRSICFRLTPRKLYATRATYSSRLYTPSPSRPFDTTAVCNGDGRMTEDESDDCELYYDVATTERIDERSPLRTLADVDTSSELRCCICLKRIRFRHSALLFPCFHNDDMHPNCAWDWVCCHPRTDLNSGTYYISCPMCRSTKTTRLVSYRDEDGPVSRRPALRRADSPPSHTRDM